MILYGQIGSRKFAELHSALKAKASKGLIKYIVRHYLGAEPNTKKQTNKLRLSGYGVELQIKSSEYKAQDDRKVNADGQELNAEHNNAGKSKYRGSPDSTNFGPPWNRSIANFVLSGN